MGAKQMSGRCIKVCRGVNACFGLDGSDCTACPYYKAEGLEERTCDEDLGRDILAALRLCDVPLTHCEDCRHSYVHLNGRLLCRVHPPYQFLTNARGYCDRGEPKKEEKI